VGRGATGKEGTEVTQLNLLFQRLTERKEDGEYTPMSDYDRGYIDEMKEMLAAVGISLGKAHPDTPLSYHPRKPNKGASE